MKTYADKVTVKRSENLQEYTRQLHVLWDVDNREKLVGPAQEIDHMIPLSKGGGHTIYNIVPACRSCNRKKNAKFPLNFLWSMN